jgi:hypothetical protein
MTALKCIFWGLSCMAYGAYLAGAGWSYFMLGCGMATTAQVIGLIADDDDEDEAPAKV